MLVGGAVSALHGGRAPWAWAQHSAGAGDAALDTAHDRQGWDALKKADEAVERAKRAREKIGTLLELADDGWCPKTRGEWDELLDALACYLAVWDLWRSLRDDTSDAAHAAFSAAFKGDPQGDGGSLMRHLRGKQMESQFKYSEEYRDDTYDLFARCDKRNAPVAGDGLEMEVLARVEQKKTHELALIGMAPLLVVDCPDCQKKRASIGPSVGTGR